MIKKEELIDLLMERYGSINNFGCYADNREWISTQAFVDLINSCTEYEGWLDKTII